MSQMVWKLRFLILKLQFHSLRKRILKRDVTHIGLQSNPMA